MKYDVFRILYNGCDEEAFSHLSDGLPDTMELIFTPRDNNFDELLKRYSPQAIVLPFEKSYPEPDDLIYLRMMINKSNAYSVIVIARQLTVSQAVCLMRVGAYDCLLGEVSGTVLEMIISRLMHETHSEDYSDGQILGDSQVMRNLRKKICQYARFNYPCLITGETGSGKELVAKTLHSHSDHKDGPFISVNCSAYPDGLLGTELFGSCKGAFTDSIDRKGLFESAEGGTIFLDEIGELSLQGQVKFLRVLEEKTIRRIGSSLLRPINARIISATNQDLKKLITAGRFRSDLLFRLNTLHLTVPPLREHREDIPLLARHFLGRISSATRRIDYSAIMNLVNYDWPGNVRELQAVVIRSFVGTDSTTIRAANIVFD